MKKLALLGVVFASMLTLTGCGTNAQEDAQADVEMETIRFGIMASVDAIPFVIAEERGFFEEAGVNVELEFFANPRDRDAAFQTGNLDGVMADLVAIGMYQEGGFDVRATGVTSGRFTLVTYNEINRVEDMRGKSVALAQNAAPTLILDQILRTAGLTLNDVVLEEVPAVPTRLELVRNGQSDATVLTDPFATIGLADGLHAVMSNTDIDFTPIITGFTQTAIEAKPDAIRAFYVAFDRASEYLNETPIDDYVDIVISTIGFPEELRDSIDLPFFAPNHLPTDETIAIAMEFLRERGLITQDFEPSDFISDVAIRN